MSKQGLSIPNVVPGCRIQVINEDTMRWETIASVDYTPKAIQVALKTHGLASAWVQWQCGREFWGIGNQIAKRL